MSENKNIVYFDLETQKSAADVGGWDKKRDMKMSVGVIYSTGTQSYEIFDESRANDLIKALLRADLVVGYNIINFDYEVLSAYSPLDLTQAPTLDLLVELEKAVGRKLPMDAFATGTLGSEKIADGMEALKWWKEGRIMEIAEYCCFDVKITKLLHEYGCQHKQLFYVDKFGKKRVVQVKW
ncbi:MAG: helicase [Verrucomicrobia bacterium]|nr:helicase [Verrucomicrobiota bacterium]